MSVLKKTARRGRTEGNPRAALNDINAQTDANLETIITSDCGYQECDKIIASLK